MAEQRLAELVAEVAGSAPLEWRSCAGGYTHASKWLVRLADGSEVFVKDGAEPLELLVHRSVEAAFLPRLLGTDGDALVLESLGDALWPPPYPADPAPLFSALDAVAATAAPTGVPPLRKPDPPLWTRVAEEREAFLRLGVCTPAWLTSALAPLAEAERRFDPAGDSLLHADVYAGNVCFGERGAVLVDWACARRGNPWFDKAQAWISIRIEGGVPPALAFPDEAAVAALVTGDWAFSLVSARPPSIDAASALDEAQLADLRHGLRWASEALGIEPPN